MEESEKIGKVVIDSFTKTITKIGSGCHIVVPKAYEDLQAEVKITKLIKECNLCKQTYLFPKMFSEENLDICKTCSDIKKGLILCSSCGSKMNYDEYKYAGTELCKTCFSKLENDPDLNGKKEEGIL